MKIDTFFFFAATCRRREVPPAFSATANQRCDSMDLKRGLKIFLMLGKRSDTTRMVAARLVHAKKNKHDFSR